MDPLGVFIIFECKHQYVSIDVGDIDLDEFEIDADKQFDILLCRV